MPSRKATRSKTRPKTRTQAKTRTRPKAKAKARPKVARSRRPAPPPDPDAQPSPLDYCPGCGEYKPLRQWTLESDESTPDRAFVCRDCRKARRAPRQESMPELSGRTRKILRDAIVCRSIAEVAKRNKLSPERVKHMLQGTGNYRDLEGEKLRSAWQELLTMEGLDLLTIARLARLSLHAMKPMWNRDKERWDFFPDHMARIQAMRWLTSMYVPSAKPMPANQPRQAPGVVVLDLSGRHRDTAPDAFTIEGEVVKP